MVETNNPKDELKPAFDIIGDVLETFITISELYEPVDTTFKDNVNFFKNRFLLLHHLILFLTLKTILRMLLIYIKKFQDKS